MVKVRKDLPKTDDGAPDLPAWAGRVTDAHDHLEAGHLVYVAQAVSQRSPDLLDTGLELAELVADLNMDQSAVSAALCYRVVRSGRWDEADVAKVAGTDAARICTAVAAMATTSLLELSNSPLLEKEQQDQVDNIKRMLVAMIDDVRVAVVKLAERLLALRIAKHQDETRRRRIAVEALRVFAPLAGRLGIYQIKWEMEDLALRYTQPDVYKEIARQLKVKRTERELQVEGMIDQVRGLLRSQGIDAAVYGRAKNIFSIWRKMQAKKVGFDSVHDVRAVRVVVATLAECYAALGVIHSTWQHIPAEFDDYIANPKENGYRSIHTAVMAGDGRPLEIQIRTRAMHEDAELGVCAHWSYKGGGVEDAVYDAKMNWLRQVIEWHEDLGGTQSLSTLLRHRVSDDRIYVSTPAGHVLDLPSRATVLDFAYRVHTDVGHSAVSGVVNGTPVGLGHRLSTGQQVQVVTAEGARPRREWLEPSLELVTTDRARAKLFRYFRSLQAGEQQHIGRDMFAQALTAMGLPVPQDTALQGLADKSGCADVAQLWRCLGSGELGMVDTLQQWLGEGHAEQLSLPGVLRDDAPLYCRFKITGSNRDGLLHDLTQVIAQLGLALTGATGRVSIPDSQAIITVDVTLGSWLEMIRLVSLIALVDGVAEVCRIPGETGPQADAVGGRG